jgi:sugar O-acyltransferase (sialic acid O-acetyltransferase NeuD family)
MTGIVIIGAGGHGREVADIIRHQSVGDSSIELVGFIDENPDVWGLVRDGAPVLGGWTWFDGRSRDDIRVICAVGAPRVSCRLAAHAEGMGLQFVQAISLLAWVSPFARLGCGVTVFPNVVINTGTVLRDHSIVNVGATISHDCDIGAYSFIAPGVHLAGNVTVGEACWIGLGASVIQGCSIGPRTVVGAGAAVIRDLGADVTAVGVPARVMQRRSKE